MRAQTRVLVVKFLEYKSSQNRKTVYGFIIYFLDKRNGGERTSDLAAAACR